MEYRKLKTLAKYPTGKLNSNAAVEDGEYPFSHVHMTYSVLISIPMMENMFFLGVTMQAEIFRFSITMGNLMLTKEPI